MKMFWGCRNGTECVQYGKARTPFGVRDIMEIIKTGNQTYIVKLVFYLGRTFLAAMNSSRSDDVTQRGRLEQQTQFQP